MTITQIKYFLAVADYGSLLKASEKLYITHQALGKQVKAIEKELDLELFDRNDRHSLCLTESGKVLYSAWKEMIAKHDEAVAQAFRLKHQNMTSLTVGIQNMPKIRLESMNAFAKYKNSSAAFDFDYKFGTPEEIRLMLDNNEIDLAILFSPSVEYPEKHSFYIINEHKENPVIAISVDNPISRNKSLNLKDIEHETFIMIDDRYSRDIVKKQYNDFIANGINPEQITIRKVSDPNELVMSLVLNQGVALIHEAIIEHVKDKICTFPYKTAEENSNAGTIIIWKDHNYDKLAKTICTLFKEE